MRLLLVLLSCVPGLLQTPCNLYEAVLAHVSREAPDRQIVLDRRIGNFTCLVECGGPLVVGTIDSAWAADATAKGLLRDTCTKASPAEPCIQARSGRPVDLRESIEVGLSSVRFHEGGGAEVLATLFGQRANGKPYGVTLLYGLEKEASGRWSVVSTRTAHTLDFAPDDGSRR